MAASNASNATRRQDFVVGMNEGCRRMFLRAQLLLMCFSYSMETEFGFFFLFRLEIEFLSEAHGYAATHTKVVTA